MQLTLSPSAFVVGTQPEAAGALAALTGSKGGFGGFTAGLGLGGGASVTPPSYEINRDMIYCLLQILRQLHARPHVTRFDFPPVPAFIPKTLGAAGGCGPEG